MRYMLLICDDRAEPPGPRETGAQPEFDRWMRDLDAKGASRGRTLLRPASESMTVRVRDGRQLVSDGPFAETKERIAGYDILECRDMAEAIELAAMHPAAKFGAIEVRPVWQ
ncbi:YciI family protein [Kibdelosporangium phytohabitans]|uniref:Transcription initiation protein n=1 Tax=Kibdelosporangium phytohabitans TaxID=860235 RepID=A0A0N9HQ33_9PSEU|nr:YciI family protein [Kibdelosporangium phytohabitans]ALG06787.1 transcription initiation protein [Kibdelosporangium phytohabitans]MBE1468026.1 hypothetical protein [Kibdelosporangium phytohabitans]